MSERGEASGDATWGRLPYDLLTGIRELLEAPQGMDAREMPLGFRPRMHHNTSYDVLKVMSLVNRHWRGWASRATKCLRLAWHHPTWGISWEERVSALSTAFPNVEHLRLRTENRSCRVGGLSESVSVGDLLLVQSWRHLTHVSAELRVVSDGHMEALASMTGLRGLNLEAGSYDCTTCEGVRCLSKLVNLTSLSLLHVRGATGSSVQSLSALVNLRHLNVSPWPTVADVKCLSALSNLSLGS